MTHYMGLELNQEKCVSVHLKRGKYADSENLPIDKDSTIKALQQADRGGWRYSDNLCFKF